MPPGYNATQLGWVGPGPMPTAASYAAAYQWNAVWGAAVGVAVAFYILSVMHLEGLSPFFGGELPLLTGPHHQGATHLQMGAAISSIIAMVLFDFTFEPLVQQLDFAAHPTLYKQMAMNVVTRILAFATAGLVACPSRLADVVAVLSCAGRWLWCSTVDSSASRPVRGLCSNVPCTHESSK